MNADGTIDTLSKRERLQVSRTRAKIREEPRSIASMNRLPAALFIVDIHREHIAVAEAKLGIPTFAIVDTNTDPSLVDFPIPANDDATRSIEKIVGLVCESVEEGLAEEAQKKKRLLQLKKRRRKKKLQRKKNNH